MPKSQPLCAEPHIGYSDSQLLPSDNGFYLDPYTWLTSRHSLFGPGSIPWEMANAFSSMSKQWRLMVDQTRNGFEILEDIPI